ncbi:MAG: HNH endonuclease [Chloroflexi bacterium]|nr:HNH endonuclease [Chloroflexota bacterium]MBV9894770.1 HNH endonuclease [Chloroflexota bacterium]
MFAHRYAYLVAIGAIPRNQIVQQVCGEKLCVRPDHLTARRRAAPHCPLELRARGDTNGSRARPEKRPRGERCHSARLTPADVIAIRQQHAMGTMTYARFVSKYGVSENTIARIVRGETWRHVPGFAGRTKTARRKAALAPYPTVRNSPQMAY